MMKLRTKFLIYKIHIDFGEIKRRLSKPDKDLVDCGGVVFFSRDIFMFSSIINTLYVLFSDFGYSIR